MKSGFQKISLVSLHKHIVKFLSCLSRPSGFTLRLHKLQSLSTSPLGKGGILYAQPKFMNKGAGRDRAEGEMPSVACSDHRPAFVTAPRLWGQTRDNTPGV